MGLKLTEGALSSCTCVPFGHQRPQLELCEASTCQNLVKAIYFEITLVKLILCLNPVEIKLDSKNDLRKRWDCPFVLILLSPQTVSPLILSAGFGRCTSCNPYACDFCRNGDGCNDHRHSGTVQRNHKTECRCLSSAASVERDCVNHFPLATGM